MEGMTRGEDYSKENLQKEGNLDLSEVLVRTVSDLQVMKEKYDGALTLYSKIFDAMELSEDMEVARQMMSTGLEVHDSLLNFIKDACQLVGIVIEWIEVKEEPELETILMVETADVLLDDTIEAFTKPLDLNYIKENCMVSTKKSDHDMIFSCDHCEKSFKTKGHLTEHKKLKHGSQICRKKVPEQKKSNMNGSEEKKNESLDKTENTNNKLRAMNDGELDSYYKIPDNALESLNELLADNLCQVSDNEADLDPDNEGLGSGEKKNKSPDKTENTNNKLRAMNDGELDSYNKIPDNSLLADNLCQVSDNEADLDPDYHDEGLGGMSSKPSVSGKRKERPFACNICKKTFTMQRSLRKHERSVNCASKRRERPFACNICKRTFTLQSSLEKHERSVNCAPAEDRPFVCNICNTTYANQGNWRIHLNLVHGRDVSDKEECLRRKHKKMERLMEKKKMLLVQKKVERPSVCNFCGKTYPYKRNLERHQKLIHGQNLATLLEKEEYLRRKKKKMKGLTEKQQQLLGMETNPTYQGIDEKVESGKVEDKENEIGESKDDGKNYKGVPCEVCGKFISSNSMALHMKVHTGEKPFKCDICDKSFISKAHLVLHQKGHKCNHCNQQFKNSDEKRQHTMAHHFVPIEREKVVCDLCGYSTSSQAGLRKHMLHHTGEKPHKCPECQKGFKSKHFMQAHLLQHTGEMPFECDVCKRRFKMKDQLKNHYRLHTGEKPFHCEFCGKAFHLSGARSQHRKKCHLACKLEFSPEPSKD